MSFNPITNHVPVGQQPRGQPAFLQQGNLDSTQTTVTVVNYDPRGIPARMNQPGTPTPTIPNTIMPTFPHSSTFPPNMPSHTVVQTYPQSRFAHTPPQNVQVVNVNVEQREVPGSRDQKVTTVTATRFPNT